PGRLPGGGTASHPRRGVSGRHREMGDPPQHVPAGGLPHHLLVLTDVSRPLREEERQAWRRLIRVLGHELNNSLAPIQSLAESLGKTLAADPLPGDWREDMRQGLNVIGSRAEALSRDPMTFKHWRM